MKLTEQIDDVLIGTEVEADSRTIKGVALNSQHSKNGYRYSEAALRSAVPLFDQKPVFLDHGSDQSNPRNRSVREMAGSLRNPRFESGRNVADIVTLDTEAGRTLLALAAHNSPGIGLSQVVLAKKSKDGKLVESIQDVVSVDAVVNPATTTTFKESEAMTLEQLKQDHPELVSQIEQSAVAAERARVQAEQAKNPPKSEAEIQAEAIKAERERSGKITALCVAAKRPDLAEKFTSEGTSLIDVQAKLLEALCSANPPPDTDPQAGNPLKGGNADPDAKFKQEYAQARETLIAQGISEKAYVHSRRLDEGLDALQPGAAHIKE